LNWKRYRHDLSFGLMIKTRAWKYASQECNLGVTFTFPGMQKSVKEWAHTLLNGLSLWELESLWTLKCSKSNLKVQNSLDWNVPYTIENILRHRCLKWVRMIHLSTYNTSYGQKKGCDSKCQFHSQPLKVKNRLELHACRWCATYLWKAFD
jgi:hypothetical protein